MRDATMESAQPTPRTNPWVSIVLSVHNDARTVVGTARRLLDAGSPGRSELVVVDDGSTDTTLLELAVVDDPRLRVHHHGRRRGHGEALRTAAGLARGTHVVHLAPDLTLSCEDLTRLLEPVVAGHGQVVFGSRAGIGDEDRRRAVGHRVAARVAGALFDAHVLDLRPAVKLMPRALFASLPLHETGAGLDAEITASLLRRGIRPIGVRLAGREPRPHSLRDEVEALRVLGRIRFARARRRTAPHPR